MPTTVDEGLEDFVFVTNQPIPCRDGAQIDYNEDFNDTTQNMASVGNDDEDWGDFITPYSQSPSADAFNTFTTFQSNGFSTIHPSPSLPSALCYTGFDPFRFSIENTAQAANNSPAIISVASDPRKVGLSSLHPSPSLPSSLSSIGFDPFEFQNGNSVQPATDSPVVLDLKMVEFKKSRGPLPLAIFGGDDCEREEKEERDGPGEDKGPGRIANGILDLKQSEIGGVPNLRIPQAGINDILASLYAQSQPFKSDKGSNLKSNLNSSMLAFQSKSNPSLTGDDKESDEEGDSDFNSTTSAESTAKDTSHSSGSKLASVDLSNKESGIVEDQASIANGQMDVATDIKSLYIIPNRFTPFPPSGSVAVGDKDKQSVIKVDLIDDEFGEFMDASLHGEPKHQEDTNGHQWAVTLGSNRVVQNYAVDRNTFSPMDDASSQGSNSIRDVISKLYDREQVTPVGYSKAQIEHGQQINPATVSATADENGSKLRDKATIEKNLSTHDIMAPKMPLASADLQIYVDFYTGLKKELCFLVAYLIDDAEKAKDADQVKENSNFQQEVRKVLKDNMDSEEAHTEKYFPRKICCDELLEVLRQPMFEILESEYLLSRRLHLAEKDLNMAVELLKEAQFSIKVLTLGTADDQYAYVYTWATIVNACSQRLRYGAYIWRQATENNLQNQILSDPQGRRYIQCLGEIYRVAQIMGTSAKAYKLWILLVSRQDQLSFFSLFNECVTLWSSSGLEPALQSLLGGAHSGTGDHADVESLQRSIQNTHNTNVVELFDSDFLQQRSFCHLSLLPQEMLPELKTVSWDGENYFLRVANLWANLISREPPSLPHLQVAG